MIVLLQRVLEAQVVRRAEGGQAEEPLGAVGRGLLAFVCAEPGDSAAVIAKAARIFEDENGRMNLSAADIGGGVLVVSQFTLAADCTSGSRPSFSNGASPAEAQKAYLAYVEALRAEGLKVETGSFGAHMHVRLTNDGPATFWLKF